MQHLRLRSNHSNRKNLMPLCHCATVPLRHCVKTHQPIHHSNAVAQWHSGISCIAIFLVNF